VHALITSEVSNSDWLALHPVLIAKQTITLNNIYILRIMLGRFLLVNDVTLLTVKNRYSTSD
jgi:hypothetical protein